MQDRKLSGRSDQNPAKLSRIHAVQGKSLNTDLNWELLKLMAIKISIQAKPSH